MAPLLTAGRRLTFNSGGSGGGSVTVVNVLTTSSSNDQIPVAIETPMNVEFGPGLANDYLDLANNGDMFFFQDGYYSFDVSLNVARANLTGDSYTLFRFLRDNTQQGQTYCIQMSDTFQLPFQFHFEGFIVAGEIISFQIMQDELGIADGYLASTNPSNPTWFSVPSASIEIKIFNGFSF